MIFTFLYFSKSILVKVSKNYFTFTYFTFNDVVTSKCLHHKNLKKCILPAVNIISVNLRIRGQFCPISLHPGNAGIKKSLFLILLQPALRIHFLNSYFFSCSHNLTSNDSLAQIIENLDPMLLSFLLRNH